MVATSYSKKFNFLFWMLEQKALWRRISYTPIDILEISLYACRQKSERFAVHLRCLLISIPSNKRAGATKNQALSDDPQKRKHAKTKLVPESSRNERQQSWHSCQLELAQSPSSLCLFLQFFTSRRNSKRIRKCRREICLSLSLPANTFWLV
jgi:hypothetical protein